MISSSKKSLVALIAVFLTALLCLSLAACDDTPESQKTEGAFESKIAFKLDCGDVPTFGAFIEESTATFEIDGTFSVEYVFTAAGAAMGPSVFPNYDGTYKLNDSKTEMTLNLPTKAISNQSPDTAETVVEVKVEFETLDDNSYKYSLIFNEVLPLPYYSNAENFDSLKEFEYPAALGEKIVFASAQNFVADLNTVGDLGDLGKMTEFTIELLDDGSYSMAMKLSSEQGAYNLNKAGAYKINNATAPTEITLLEENTEITNAAKYAVSVEDGYITITYVNDTFGTITLYNDIDKIPSDGDPAEGWPSETLGTYNPFENVKVFTGTTTYGTATFTFKKDGSVVLNVIDMDFPLFYTLNETCTTIILYDGGSTQNCNITLENGLMKFTYNNVSVGDVDFTETANS